MTLRVALYSGVFRSSLGGAAVAAARSLFRAERFDRAPVDYARQLSRVLG